MATAKYSPVSFLRNRVSAVTNDSALDLKFSLVIRCCLSERDQVWVRWAGHESVQDAEQIDMFGGRPSVVRRWGHTT
jgi:hypothetical protein